MAKALPKGNEAKSNFGNARDRIVAKLEKKEKQRGGGGKKKGEMHELRHSFKLPLSTLLHRDLDAPL